MAGAVWRLALATGLRRGELLGLWWSDIDLGVGEARIRRQVPAHLVAGGPWTYVRETTKARRERLVRFDAHRSGAPRLAGAAGRGAARLRTRVPHARRPRVEAPWLVTEANGYEVNPDTLLDRRRALASRASVRPIPLHAARHTYATLPLRAGVRLHIMSRQPGDARIGVTADVYGHDDPEAHAGGRGQGGYAVRRTAVMMVRACTACATRAGMAVGLLATGQPLPIYRSRDMFPAG